MNHSTWSRTSSLSPPAEFADEVWTSPAGQPNRVRVRFGKKVDIFGLKHETFSTFAKEVEEIKRSREAMYSPTNLEPVSQCPICGEITPSATLMEVYGASYSQCPACSHVFVRQRMTTAALARYYTEDKSFAATYTERVRADLRLNQVARPKAEWAIEAFRRRYGRTPQRVLDVGAGGGHFVKACRDLGMQADGIEPSRWSQAFCKEYFGFDLIDAPFNTDYRRFADADLITFWGVIEHVASPHQFMSASRAVLGNKGMTVVAVPRWTSLSTAIQLFFHDTLVRHMDPGGHVHVFSDNSLLTLLDLEGFLPTDAWFFGMDTYELISQILHQADVNAASLASSICGLVGTVQPFVDRSRLSDEVVLAAVPG